MGVADPEQRQTGRPENILGFELGYRCLLQGMDVSRGRLFVVEQEQVGQSCRIVVLFGLARPLDFGGLRGHGLDWVTLETPRAIPRLPPDCGMAARRKRLRRECQANISRETTHDTGT